MVRQPMIGVMADGLADGKRGISRKGRHEHEPDPFSIEALLRHRELRLDHVARGFHGGVGRGDARAMPRGGLGLPHWRWNWPPEPERRSDRPSVA